MSDIGTTVLNLPINTEAALQNTQEVKKENIQAVESDKSEGGKKPLEGSAPTPSYTVKISDEATQTLAAEQPPADETQAEQR